MVRELLHLFLCVELSVLCHRILHVEKQSDRLMAHIHHLAHAAVGNLALLNLRSGLHRGLLGVAAHDPDYEPEEYVEPAAALLAAGDAHGRRHNRDRERKEPILEVSDHADDLAADVRADHNAADHVDEAWHEDIEECADGTRRKVHSHDQPRGTIGLCHSAEEHVQHENNEHHAESEPLHRVAEGRDLAAGVGGLEEGEHGEGERNGHRGIDRWGFVAHSDDVRAVQLNSAAGEKRSDRRPRDSEPHGGPADEHPEHRGQLLPEEDEDGEEREWKEEHQQPAERDVRQLIVRVELLRAAKQQARAAVAVRLCHLPVRHPIGVVEHEITLEALFPKLHKVSRPALRRAAAPWEAELAHCRLADYRHRAAFFALLDLQQQLVAEQVAGAHRRHRTVRLLPPPTCRRHSRVA